MILLQCAEADHRCLTWDFFILGPLSVFFGNWHSWIECLLLVFSIPFGEGIPFGEVFSIFLSIFKHSFFFFFGSKVLIHSFSYVLYNLIKFLIEGIYNISCYVVDCVGFFI